MATLKKEHIHHFKGGLAVFLNKNPLQNAPSLRLWAIMSYDLFFLCR